jgi:hypothetical protein
MYILSRTRLVSARSLSVGSGLEYCPDTGLVGRCEVRRQLELEVDQEVPPLAGAVRVT